MESASAIIASAPFQRRLWRPNEHTKGRVAGKKEAAPEVDPFVERLFIERHLDANILTSQSFSMVPMKL